MRSYSVTFIAPIPVSPDVELTGRSFIDVARKITKTRSFVKFIVYSADKNWMNAYINDAGGLRSIFPRAKHVTHKTETKTKDIVSKIITLRDETLETNLMVIHQKTFKYRRKTAKMKYLLMVPEIGVGIHLGGDYSHSGTILYNLLGPDFPSGNFERFENIEFEHKVDGGYLANDVPFIHANLSGRWSFFYNQLEHRNIFRFESVEDAIRYRFNQ